MFVPVDKFLQLLLLSLVLLVVRPCLFFELVQRLRAQLANDLVDLLSLSMLVSQLHLEHRLVDLQGFVIRLVAFVSCNLLPSRFDIRHISGVKGVNVVLDHNRHSKASDVDSTVDLRTSIVDDLVSESIDPLDELPP